MIDMFKYPSVSSLADFLSKEERYPVTMRESKDRAETRKELMKRRQAPRQRTSATPIHERVKHD